MTLTNAQIEAALEHYSDPLYPLDRMLFVYEDPKTGVRTPIPFWELVAECEKRKWWAEQSTMLLKALVQAFDGKGGDPYEIIDAARRMFEGDGK